MAAAPSIEKSLRFNIGQTNLAFGLIEVGEFGWTMVLAKEIAAGNWYYISQSQMYDLAYRQDAPDEEIYAFCESALAQANRVLAEEYPAGGVTSPSTPIQKVDAWVVGLMFDPTTNQIKRK